MATKPTGNPVGRPSQLKDPARQAILDAIQNGAPYTEACAAVGISTATMRGWKRQGELDTRAGKSSAFAAFFADVQKARGLFVAEGVAAIKEASRQSWQARAWLLERRRPELFADNRAELRRMEKQVAELMKLLADIKPAPPPEIPLATST